MQFGKRWLQWTEELIAELTRGGPHRREGAALIVIGAFLAVEVVDYLTGVRLSLLFFYLVPVTLAVAWLGWLTGIVVAFLSLATRSLGDYFAGGREPLEAWVWWNNALAFGMFVLIVSALHALFRLHRTLEARIRERTTDLQAALAETQRLQRELIDVGARERASIGRDLHDDLGQQLFATALASKVLAQRLQERAPEAAAEAQSIVHWLDDAIAKTRDLAHGLLLASIDPRRLEEELAELAAKHHRGGVECRLRVEGQPEVGDHAAAAQLFRIAQEAVRNAVAHGEPTRVDVLLAAEPSAVRLEVIDDGLGMPPPEEPQEGMGLRIMAYRAGLIGGTLSVLPVSPRGTRIVCRVPHPPSS